MSSYAFSSFLDSYFGDPYMAWHDGLDEQSLLSLEGDELKEAERMLIAGVGSGDSRAAAGLAALRSKEAAPKLKEQLPTAQGDNLIKTALALWQIEKYQPALVALIDALKNEPHWGTRINAAMALRQVETQESVNVLREALNDGDELVRNHATESLFALYGIAEEEGQDKLSIQIMVDSEDERPETIAAIKKKLVEDGNGMYA